MIEEGQKKLIIFFLFSTKKQGSKCEQNILLAPFCESLCVFVLLIQTWVLFFCSSFPLLVGALFNEVY